MIFLDTNVVSETLRKQPDSRVVEWLIEHDAELALPTVTIAEIAYGIQKIRPGERARRLMEGLNEWRRRFAGRIYGFDEEAALGYGDLMGKAARQGAVLSVPAGMIAAIAGANGGRLATRNTEDFRTSGLSLINPWD